jgi:hypothetical protein
MLADLQWVRRTFPVTPFLTQLAELCRAERTCAKWVIVPTHMLGHTLGERLALGSSGWANVRFTTPLDLALPMAAPFLVERGVDPAPDGLGPALIMRLLLELPGAVPVYFREMAEQPRMAEALWETIRELRMARMRAGDLRRAAFTSAAKHAELSALLAAYEEHLATRKLADTAAMSRARPKDQPDWPVQDLLYVKVPILAFRNYLNDDTDDQWPLCWEEARIIPALRMAAEILKPWQAFRSNQPVSTEEILERLEPDFPKIVLGVQEILAACSLQCITDLSPTSDKYSKVLLGMADAVTGVAKAKQVDNPMLGSKILGFFFPDFFPIWDTEWVKPALSSAYEVPGWPEFPTEIEEELSGRKAGLEYARYVHRLVQDASKSTNVEYAIMKAECVKACQNEGYHKPEHVLDEFYYDLTPMLFEVCLLGSAARACR